jgi:integrase/recombinase XerD
MADTRVSPLRQRMIEDMTMRNFAPRTQEGYIRAVKAFAAFLGRSPAEASFEDVRRFQLHLVATGTGVPTINGTLTALRFFFTVTLRRPATVADLPFIKEPRKLPVVLSPEEVARLLEAAPGLKYKAALSVAYGAGLRVSEITSLKVSDIDSARMVIRVEQGKGRKDRYVMLSPQLLDLLRAWWKAARVPLRRRSPGHRRELRARQRTATASDHPDPDRYLMIVAAGSQRSNAAPLRHRRPTGDEDARPTRTRRRPRVRSSRLLVPQAWLRGARPQHARAVSRARRLHRAPLKRQRPAVKSP